MNMTVSELAGCVAAGIVLVALVYVIAHHVLLAALVALSVAVAWRTMRFARSLFES